MNFVVLIQHIREEILSYFSKDLYLSIYDGLSVSALIQRYLQTFACETSKNGASFDTFSHKLLMFCLISFKIVIFFCFLER